MMSAVTGAIVEVTMNTIGKKAKGLGHMACINRTSRGRKPPVSFSMVSGDSTEQELATIRARSLRSHPSSDITNAPTSRETPLLVVVV